MFADDDDIKPAPDLTRERLERMSVMELEALINGLQERIREIEGLIEKKKAASLTASSVFKS